MQTQTLNFMAKVTEGMVTLAGLIREDTNQILGGKDLLAVIQHYDQLRKAVESIKTARKALEEIEDNMSKVNVPDIMRENSVKTINVEGVGRVTISHRFSCSMLDKDAGYNWLRDNGHGGLITATVNSSALSAFAKEMLTENGEELPPEIFKVGTQAYTSITKG